MQNITFKQYRNIDLTILSVLLVISEGVTTVATTRWFVGVPFAISTTLIFVLICMMRWSYYGVIPALIGGVVFSVASGADLGQTVIYTVGNVFCLLSMLLIHFVGKDRLRSSPYLLGLYALTTYLSIALGRWLVSLIFDPSIRSLPVYVLTDVVTLLFSAVLLILMRKVDGMIEDQHSYILRQQEERRRHEGSDGDDLSEIQDAPDYLDDAFGDRDLSDEEE